MTVAGLFFLSYFLGLENSISLKKVNIGKENKGQFFTMHIDLRQCHRKHHDMKRFIHRALCKW